MAEQPLRILQIGASDLSGGGAEKIGWQLFQTYRQRGHQSWLAVGSKHSQNPDVWALPHDTHRNLPTRLLLRLAELIARKKKDPNLRLLLRRAAQLTGDPRRYLNFRQGKEDFDFPGTWDILDLPPELPGIVHAHNLHRNYFDLRALPWLSAQVPLVLTLHDAWLLSGHCAHSFECERWKTGCGHCPDLTIYPPIQRDASAYNWQRKRDIYAGSRLYVATPSQWLMSKVRESMLYPAVVESRVISSGMDLSVFQPPRDKRKVRDALDIPSDALVLLFVASGIRNNMWKDFRTLRAAVGQVGELAGDRQVRFIALGEGGPPERIGPASVQFVPYQSSPEQVARYYQAADIYIHAARVDTFPNTVIEALACGAPVVATAVGGIPEQIKSPDSGSLEDEATGILVPAGDAGAMSDAIMRLLTNEPLRRRMGENAARDARQRFSLDSQADTYLAWYREIMDAAGKIDN